MNLNGETTKLLSWSNPGETEQFSVLAGDYSPESFASIILDQFTMYLNSLRINFDIALLAHDPTYLLTLEGGFALFYLDFSTPTGIAIGEHPDSPVSEIRAMSL